MSFFQDFKVFALRGSVIDMAVGVIIGTAFGKIASSLVTDVIMPPIGLLIGGMDFSSLKINLGGDVSINYGLFINTVINFILIALAIFVALKGINKLRAQPLPKSPDTKNCPQCMMSIPVSASRCGHCTSTL